jgi:hypothetical protein
MYAMFIEPLAPSKFWIDMASAACALGAALFWLRASLVRTPTTIRKPKNLSMLDGEFGRDVSDVALGIARQGRLNAVAAAFASVAAVLTALSVVIGTRWD